MDSISDYAKKILSRSPAANFTELLDAAKGKLNIGWGGMKASLRDAMLFQRAVTKNRNGFTPQGIIRHADFLHKLDQSPGYPKGAPAILPPSCFDYKQLKELAELSKVQAQEKRDRKAKRRAATALAAAKGYYRMQGRWEFNPSRPFQRELV
jgi:hypothetical protein